MGTSAARIRPEAPRGCRCVALTGAGNPCPRFARHGDLCASHRGSLAARGRCVAVYGLTGARCPRPVSGARRAYGCLCVEHAGQLLVVWGVCDLPWETRERLARRDWRSANEVKEWLR
jgi:hypothetical protein